MPQTGMALETWSNLWGRTCNPYNANLGSGGSSGGDGVLVAMRGVPCAPLTSDIGGSIRAPAAFNGLYGMRPTSDRVPKFGVQSTAPGQLSIKVSVGPNCHSLADLKLLVKLILTHPTLPYEPTCIPGSWVDIKTSDKKLKIGVLSSDGVVDPHPPIQRALKETAEKLRAAGHDGRQSLTKRSPSIHVTPFTFLPFFPLRLAWIVRRRRIEIAWCSHAIMG